jgi:hypothetical protein
MGGPDLSLCIMGKVIYYVGGVPHILRIIDEQNKRNTSIFVT